MPIAKCHRDGKWKAAIVEGSFSKKIVSDATDIFESVGLLKSAEDVKKTRIGLENSGQYTVCTTATEKTAMDNQNK